MCTYKDIFFKMGNENYRDMKLQSPQVIASCRQVGTNLKSINIVFIKVRKEHLLIMDNKADYGLVNFLLSVTFFFK